MITAFVRHPDGRYEMFEDLAAVASCGADRETQIWIDLESPNEEELKRVGELFKLDSEALEDCIQGQQRPRIDEFEDYIFMVLYGAVDADEPHTFDPQKLAVFCSDRFLITVQRVPLVTLRVARQRCKQHPAQMLGKGVDYVLFFIIDAMVDKYVLVTTGYERDLLALEDKSLEVQMDETLLGDLSHMRTELLELKQVVLSQKELILPLARGECEYISESLQDRFRHINDHLAHALDLIDRHRELVQSIRENYHTALSARTNTLMTRLTVLATIMLPLTLIAGVYGMNLPLWPPPDQMWSFWVVVSAMVLIATLMLIYFKRKNWFS